MWHTLRAFGFVYYEIYLSLQTHEAIAWVSRKSANVRYTAFYCDGKHKTEAKRGSAHNARQFVRNVIAKYGT